MAPSGPFLSFPLLSWSNSREEYVFHQLMELMDEAAAPFGCAAACRWPWQMAASRVTVASVAAHRATAHIIHLPQMADESVARSSSTDVDVIVHATRCNQVVQCLSSDFGVVGFIPGWVIPMTLKLAPIVSLLGWIWGGLEHSVNLSVALLVLTTRGSNVKDNEWDVNNGWQ